MILSDSKILKARKASDISIDPFDRKNLGSNSYDVHLSPYIAEYRDPILDAKKHNQVRHSKMTKAGIILKPGKLYLGSTVEYTETRNYVPFLEGKSSTGRLGINIHATAGKGDDGFCGHWTLEISVVMPVRVYPGMPIGQLIYHTVEGKVDNPYDKKVGAKYSNKDPRPKESMMWKNEF